MAKLVLLFVAVFACLLVGRVRAEVEVDPAPTDRCPSTEAWSVVTPQLSPTCQTSKLAETDDKIYPYCVLTTRSTTGGADTFECRECVSNCDCDLDEYCSSERGQVGICREFEKEGEPCRPLTQAQIEDNAYDDLWKCADIFTDVDLSGQSVVRTNYRGYCDEGTCRMCDMDARNNRCYPWSGMGPERTCVSGSYRHTHDANWKGEVYGANTSAVWKTIFFTFFLMILICQTVRTVLIFSSK